jgi:hypothetical protein
MQNQTFYVRTFGEKRKSNALVAGAKALPSGKRKPRARTL